MKAAYLAAGGVVFDELGRVLALNRPSRSEVRLPKGHVEPDETCVEAAMRETAEESGYDDLEMTHDLGRQTVRFEFDGKRVVRDERYYAFRLASDRKVMRRPKDAKQFSVMWLSTADAVERLTYEAEREWVRRAVRATT